MRGFVNQVNDLDKATKDAARSQFALGTALTSAGVGLLAAGAAATAWFYESAKMAQEFQQGIALVETQTDKVKASQKELGDIVKRVAREVAVPLKDLDNGLFDIFSSMDVGLGEAETLLAQFSKAAVTGATNLETAGRASIAIMNAWHIPASEVNRVLDVQFQLVRKGVGTYEEFATTIGRAIPSAQRAGQSVETLAGMLAFLTRNGLSAAMASASAGRAFDAFANVKVVERLEGMGVAMRNNEGGFREMGEVILDLQKKLEGMSDPERAAALQDLFQGAGGTIQARRFYDLVLKDAEAAQQFVSLVGDMKNASGEFLESYEVMANTSVNKTQVLKNNWELFRIEVGDAVIPILNKLMEAVTAGLQWWNGLSESVRKSIIIVALIATGLTVLLGVVTILAGGFMLLSGAAAAFGITVTALLGWVALIVVAVAALVAGIIWLWKNWDTVTQALAVAWQWLWDKIGPVVLAIRDGLVAAFQWVWEKLQAGWEWLRDNFGQRIIDLFNRVKDDITGALTTVANFFQETWDKITTWTQSRWESIRSFIMPFVDLVMGIILPVLNFFWLAIQNVWNLIVTITQAAWGHFLNIIKEVFDIVMSTIEYAWNIIVAIFRGAWEIISSIISGFISFIMGLIDIIVGVFTGNWSQAWEGVKEIFRGIWEIITGVFSGVWEILKGIVGNGLAWIWDIIKSVTSIVVEIFKGFWDTIVAGFKSGVQFIKDIWNTIMDIMKAPINFVIDVVYNKGIRAVWNKIAGFLGLGELPEVGLLGESNAGGSTTAGRGQQARAKGGVLPGYSPGIDNMMVPLSGGEGILVPEAVRGLGPQFVYWANNFFSRGRTAGAAAADGRGYADGGIVSTVMSFVGGVADDVVQMFKDPVGFIVGRTKDNQFVRGAAGLMNKAVDGVIDKVWSWFQSSGGGGSGMGWQQMWEIVRKQFPDANLTSAKRDTPDFHGQGTAIDVAWAMDEVGKNKMLVLNKWLAQHYRNSAEIIHTPGINLKNGAPFDYSAAVKAAHYNHVHWASGGSGNVMMQGASPFLTTWIRAAMKHTGVADNWFEPLMTLIMRESGGNPRAINNWDINAQRGDPSRGLMQTIGSTFNAYRDARLSGDIYDPIANIVAGINYIKARYGSIFTVQQADRTKAMKGYDNGGVMPPGVGTYFNGTGVPEAVLTADQWEMARRALSRATSEGSMGVGFGGGLQVKIVNYDVNITIYTNEIDPRRHALELGRELEQGVG
jgi:TP901 family phage tail tape measure protein